MHLTTWCAPDTPPAFAVIADAGPTRAGTTALKPERVSVLLVEDNPGDADLVQELLRLAAPVVAGAVCPEVQQVDTLRRALAAADGAFDVVLLDLGLPDASGFEALEQLHAAAPRLPIVVLTGERNPHVAAQALTVGAEDFLVKAEIDGELLLRSLRFALARQQRGAERKELERRLARTERLATVGTMASGMVHELNNPLSFVVANVNFAADEIGRLCDGRGDAALPHACRETLGELRSALADARLGADRLHRIISDLAIFSRGGDGREEGPADAREALEIAARMVSHELKHRATIERRYGELPPVGVSDSRLGQVFVNLLLNAAHAIPEGDATRHRLTLVTSTDARGWAVVEVGDTGSGIRPEHLEHIFDPFFTTKPVGKGTGLGLSICYGIVKDAGGELTVTSTVGLGTTFRLALPPSRRTSTAAPGAVPRDPPELASRPRILVIDDEPLVGRATARLLGRRHDVTTLTSARDGLARIVEGTRFDAILCDLQMPDMNGPAFHADLREVDPEQAERIVFLTGGAFTPDTRAFMERPSVKYVLKPFAEQDLVAAISEALARAASRPARS